MSIAWQRASRRSSKSSPTSSSGRHSMPRARKAINQINVVPYIDVMLVLLVIFMVTAPLVAPGEIELPSVGSKLTVPTQPLEVRLNSDGSLSLRDRQTNAFAPKISQDELVRR